MIKVECIKDFTLKDFNKLENIKRRSIANVGHLYVGDTFECNEDMVKYLTGDNKDKEVVVKVIEVEPKLNELGNVIGTRKIKSKKKKSSKKGE